MSLTTLHVWRIPRRNIPAAMLGLARSHMPKNPGKSPTFAKFLGTSTGTTFGPGDADLTRYAAITVSDEPTEFPYWNRLARNHVRLDLDPISSRGRWSGAEPFKSRTTGRPESGMVLALTRARLRPSRAVTFWRAIPPVARELHEAPGLLARFGVGEAPIGWQGTVSIWREAADLVAFAYRQPQHREVIARTPADRWYAEDLFARFAVREISGDRAVLGWDEKG